MRIRTIKPSFFTNDQVAELKPLTRLLFIGLWCMADVAGRLEDRPRRIKVALLPYDSHDVETALADLASAGFIKRYVANGVRVIQVVNFDKHQRIMGKEAETESTFPPFTGETPGKHPGDNGETTENAGREGKGKEGNKEGRGDSADAPVSADLEKPPGKTGDKNGCPDTPDESKPLPEPNAKQEQPPQEPEPPQKNGRRFVRPTDDELKLMAAKIGLPESERLKFAAYYDANGWKVGRNPMKSPSAAE
jgi:hypothetical protein